MSSEIPSRYARLQSTDSERAHQVVEENLYRQTQVRVKGIRKIFFARLHETFFA
jgi:hypothetical protein